MPKGKLYIGTSGWHYKHWLGPFYPEDTKDDDMLKYYTQYFDTVEINNSFYHLPLIETFRNWKKTTPQGFTFSVKGSRYITHMKKLKVDKATVSELLKRIKGLGTKTGPVLFQLPPGWKVNVERLKSFLQILPKKYRFAFEFRNETWFDDEIYHLLNERGCAFCIYELAGLRSPEEVTADFVYIRLHGPGDKYQGRYARRVLKQWADKINKWRKNGKDVYVYFDNDQAGYAAINARELLEECAR